MGRLLSRVEPAVSGILRDVAEARFSVSMGIDGRRGPHGTLDQLAAVMTTDGTVALARKGSSISSSRRNHPILPILGIKAREGSHASPRSTGAGTSSQSAMTPSASSVATT